MASSVLGKLGVCPPDTSRSPDRLREEFAIPNVHILAKRLAFAKRGPIYLTNFSRGESSPTNSRINIELQYYIIRRIRLTLVPRK